MIYGEGGGGWNMGGVKYCHDLPSLGLGKPVTNKNFKLTTMPPLLSQLSHKQIKARVYSKENKLFIHKETEQEA